MHPADPPATVLRIDSPLTTRPPIPLNRTAVIAARGAPHEPQFLLVGGSRLLDLDQSSTEILRMKEENRFAVGADLGLPVPQNARATRAQAIARRFDVAHLIADVVNAALRITQQKIGNR